MFSVNLIPMHRREQRKLRARRKRWMVAASVYAIALGASYGVWRGVWGAGDRDLSRQLTLVNGDLDEATKTIARLRGDLNETKLVLQVNETLAAQPDWSVLLALLAKLRGDEIVLNQCGLVTSIEKPAPTPAAAPKPGQEAAAAVPAICVETPNRVVLSARGYGRSQAAVQQFVLRLEQSGLFDSVSMLGTTREPFAGVDAVAFKLECSLRTRFTAAATVTSAGGEP